MSASGAPRLHLQSAAGSEGYADEDLNGLSPAKTKEENRMCLEVQSAHNHAYKVPVKCAIQFPKSSNM